MKKEKLIAYKGFRVNDCNQLQCRSTIFEVGKTYSITGDLVMCNNGFHYCRNLNDIDAHYTLKTSVICEIEILGKFIHDTDGKKSCTSKFKILRLLTKEQVWAISNTGKDNTGFINSGNYNSGNYNSGNYNSGNYNSGNYNSGYRNSGNSNSGYRNSGNSNSGDYNSGNYNSGDYNSGNRNSGNSNSGDYNSGNYNSGDYNSGNSNSGYFCTIENKCFIFDILTEMTPSEFINSKYMSALQSSSFILTEWISYTEKEKEQDKAKELIEGYLKKYEYKDACAKWWKNMTKANQKIVKSIPNFDAGKFEQITGIKV